MIPLGDSQKSIRFPIVTVLLIVVNTIIFIFEMVQPDLDVFFRQYAFTPALFSFTDYTTWQPIITAAFLHGGVSHLLFNMLFLWVFGDTIENELGSIRYILFYLIAIIAAALLQYAVAPASPIPMLGASGAIAGILGYYIVRFPSHKIRTIMFFGGFPTEQNIPAQLFLGYWALVQFLNGIGSLGASYEGGTAWFAHIGGFIAGFVIAKLMGAQRTNYLMAEFDD